MHLLFFFCFLLFNNAQQEFAAQYTLSRPSQTNGGVEQGTMHYSWSQAKIHQVFPYGDELMVYKAPQTGTKAVTCNTTDDSGVAGCLINMQVFSIILVD